MSEDLFAPWRDQSACFDEIKVRPHLDGAWLGPNEDGVDHPYSEEADEVCATCPVALKCLASALRNPEAQGRRAGYLFDGGKLPVGKAREIEKELGLKVGSHQSLGRPKSGEQPSQYL